MRLPPLPPITNNSHRNAKSNYIPLWALHVIPPPKKNFRKMNVPQYGLNKIHTQCHIANTQL